MRHASFIRRWGPAGPTNAVFCTHTSHSIQGSSCVHTDEYRVRRSPRGASYCSAASSESVRKSALESASKSPAKVRRPVVRGAQSCSPTRKASRILVCRSWGRRRGGRQPAGSAAVRSCLPLWVCATLAGDCSAQGEGTQCAIVLAPLQCQLKTRSLAASSVCNQPGWKAERVCEGPAMLLDVEPRSA